MARHQCNRNGGRLGPAKSIDDGWHICIVCEGRIHEDGCTTRRDPRKDHCAERHKRLHDAGQTRGISDSSFIMWTQEHPEGVHPNELRRANVQRREN